MRVAPRGTATAHVARCYGSWASEELNLGPHAYQTDNVSHSSPAITDYMGGSRDLSGGLEGRFGDKTG